MPSKKAAPKKVAKKPVKKAVKKAPAKKAVKAVKKPAKKPAKKVTAKKPAAAPKAVAVKAVTDSTGVVTMKSVDDPGTATEGQPATVKPYLDKETGVLIMVPESDD